MTALLLVAISLLGCGPRPAPAVAQVNGSPITDSAFLAALPLTLDPATDSAARERALDGLITRELFVAEASRLGLDSAITYRLELQQKGYVTEELFRSIARSTRPVTEADLELAYRRLVTVDRCHVIVVPPDSEALARRIVAELEAGVPFETLAVRHSVHSRSVARGGDVGFVSQFRMDEKMVAALLPLKPGEHTQPVLSHGAWQVVRLDERRTDDSTPFAEVKQRLEAQLGLERERKAAEEYVAALRARLEYQPEGMAVLFRPRDSIAGAELELAVAVRDGRQYVKVKRLLPTVAQFPPGLDTAYKARAIRQAIESDLIYEDGLKRGLDKVPAVKARVDAERRRLLYDQLYRREVTEKAVVTESEVQDTFIFHPERYPGGDFRAVATLIRNDIARARREARLAEYSAGLRAGARVSIDRRKLFALKRKETGQ